MFLKLRMSKPWQDYFYTLYVILNTTSYGIVFALFPNILVDMKYILNTTMELITLYPTVETGGYVLGTLVGLLYKYVNRQLVISISYFVLTISCAVLPLVPNLTTLYICAFIFGFGSSIQVCGYTVWIIEIWKNKGGALLQINDFGFGIGSILCTVILEPYLVGEIASDSNPKSMQTITTFNATQVSSIERKERLMLPCLIIGACILPISISSFVMYFIKPYKTPEIQTKQITEDLEYEETKLFDRPDTPRKTMRFLCAFWYSFYVIFETVFLKFAVTYFQFSPQKLTAQDSAQIFWISTAIYTAFRGINVFIGLKMKVFYMLSYHYVIIIIGIILLIVGQYSLTFLWIGSITLCWGFSAMFAGIFAFTDEYLTMTDKLSTIFVLIRGLFTLVTPTIIGLYIEDFSVIFIIVQSFYLICSLITFIAIIYLIRKYKKKLSANQI